MISDATLCGRCPECGRLDCDVRSDECGRTVDAGPWPDMRVEVIGLDRDSTALEDSHGNVYDIEHDGQIRRRADSKTPAR